jgi:predicted phage-related endonuclease
MTTQEITSKVTELKEIQAFIKQLTDEAEALKTAIIAEMTARKTDILNAGMFTARYTTYLSTRLDSTRFKADHGALYDAYCKTTEAHRFSIA